MQPLILLMDDPNKSEYINILLSRNRKLKTYLFLMGVYILGQRLYIYQLTKKESSKKGD